ncbi:MAG: lipoate--protein ligase [Oscillospiraceae bacterium]|jgi:lipoate-protein ligase A
MIERLSCIYSTGTDPYENLALEEHLLGVVEPGECILYLWQNRSTVVIGRNQNCWRECRVTQLEKDGGHLARRLSGGGAVYHDLGNLNFTFLVPREEYDVEKQTRVILSAVRSFGIPAERTGRNDLTVAGRKFSGHAYYRTDKVCYHHGTLLLHADERAMEKYLSVSREKLSAKSVDSIRSRVCNLDECSPNVSVSAMENALLSACSEVYSLPFLPLADERLDGDALRKLAEKYASPEWKYNRRLPFEYALDGRFDWGEVQLQLHVADGRIADIAVCSDALDTTFPDLVRAALLHIPFVGAAVKNAFAALPATEEPRAQMLRDTEKLLLEAM